jgi:hypothetical protein
VTDSRTTREGQPYNEVKAYLFRPNGRWEREVTMDFSFLPDREANPAEYWPPPAHGVGRAIQLAHSQGRSGLGPGYIPPGFILAVIDSPYLEPVVVMSPPAVSPGIRDAFQRFASALDSMQGTDEEIRDLYEERPQPGVALKRHDIQGQRSPYGPDSRTVKRPRRGGLR